MNVLLNYATGLRQASRLLDLERLRAETTDLIEVWFETEIDDFTTWIERLGERGARSGGF